MRKYQRKDENSFIFKHQVEKHNSQPANFGMRVVGSFKDPLSRQVTEAVMIKNHQGTLLNSKAEFHQPPLVRVRQEVFSVLKQIVTDSDSDTDSDSNLILKVTVHCIND